MEKHPQSFDVCIVCALPEEARAFLEVAQQQCEDTLEERISPRYHYSYRFATIKNNKGESLNLHISWLPRYGPQEMTLHLSRVLEEYQPRIAIMTGICAGDAQHVQLGDLVVAERTFTYDNGKFTLDEHGRSVHLHDTMTYQLDANIQQFLGLFDDWETYVARLHRPPSPPEQRKIVCHLKPMASGSAVRVDRPFEGVQAPVRGTVAIDMEGAAFGLVMSRHPLIRWLVVKGVCDYADKTKNDAYHDYAARVSVLYALSFIRAYVTNERLPGLDGPTSTNRAGSPGVWNVPFAHNPFFTGREQELDQLHTQLQQRNAAAIGQTQAISGLGGIGKTQLAVEYAYRYRDTYDFVLWARAESVEALNTSYIELAQLLNLPEKEEPEQAIIVQAVKTWLRTHQGYLLILDNADKPDMLVPFLPPSADGHLLLTTRSSVARRLNIASPLILETLTPEQGALFLLYRAGLLAPGTPLTRALPEDQVLAQQISQDLGGLPLAIEQAAAYIEATVTSLSAYRSLYQKHRIELLKREQPLRYPHTVATTWDISFQHVEATNHAAAELLRFCAFLAPDAIPEEILTLGAEGLGPILAPVAADTFLLNDAIAALHAYSLLARNPQAQTLTVHRLIQAVVGDNLPDETRKEWMQRAILVVNVAFPNNVEFTQWTACKRYAPHALFCATWIAQNQFTMPEAAHLLHQTGMYFAKSGRYTEAEPLLQHALTINELQLGAEHLDTITCLNNLASLYVDQGKYVEAEPLYQRVLVIREQQLEADPSHTAASLNNLAMLYIHQGRYAEAEPLLQRALAIWEQQRDTEHLNIATGLSNLGGLYVRQGKYAEAEPLLQRALVINEQHTGLNHPNTASCLNSLAYSFIVQGKLAEAEPLLQRALVINEQNLGAEHPDTITCLGNLAYLHLDRGNYMDAEFLLKRILTINEQQVGIEHPKTITNLNNLASLYFKQEKYAEAEPLLQHALMSNEQQLGVNHPDTANALNNLAYLYVKLGKYIEAEPLYQRTLAIRELQLGANHPDTATSLNNLARLYERQGRNAEAEPLYERVLAIRELQLGAEHPDTATCLNDLGVLYYNQAKYAEAEPLHQRALSIREQLLGTEHPDVAQSLNNLALLYKSQERYVEAEPLYQHALEISMRLGRDHSLTQMICKNYLIFLRTLGRGEEAKYLEESF